MSIPELETKRARLYALMDQRALDAILLQRASSFAWATGGARSQVNIAGTNGAAVLLVTRSGCHLITDNLEAARLAEEEHLPEQGWTFHVRDWYEREESIARLSGGLRMGSDAPYPGSEDLSGPISRLRAHLTPEEGERMRVLAQDCAMAVTAAARTTRPGQTEQQICARLGYEAELLAIEPITKIVAADERMARYRHALSTDRRAERYLMLVLNGRRGGLVCTITRFVHFGPLPAGLSCSHEAAARIAALCISATRPCRPLGEVLAIAQAGYAALGMPECWREHHQGGSAGYEPREYLVIPGMKESAVLGQAFVWNPSVETARSVDTFLVGPTANEVLTVDPAWPSIAVEIGETQSSRPWVLVL